jgi:hypothetical protein
MQVCQLQKAAGYYYFKADTAALTYSAVATAWAVTGSGTPNGWPDNGVQDHNMTYNKTTKGVDSNFKFISERFKSSGLFMICGFKLW